ncbi:hypothetical protein [Companilactobacillus ginsenosidimutans]|uniref:WxL domain-containing protein n=1 Tax=Companilactobacillus ginsenosidimutans TaxID=1007676 RepID=A0A0H4QHY7_9LACO|nr:hypothetical protein [Companilactobacillus ginsenosidimutans]AKP66273.1 hypothetical protein ABM34_01050 [Companilactobacillus ginsenosidimutans]
MLTGPEQTYSGDYAKYTLNGDFDKSKYKIEWHGINGIVPQSELGNDLKNYVIKKTKIEDDGKEIYATISEINPKPQYDHLHNLIPPHEIVTNHVTLHVNKSAPLLSTDHFIREKPKSDGVNELTYHGSKHLWHELHVINSTSNEYEPENGWTGKLYYYLSKNEKVENVYNIDGFTKTKLDFDSLTFDKAKITLQINNLKLSKKELLQIQIQTRVINTDQPTFNYSPELIIPTPGNSESNFTQRFQENRVIFSNGNLKISPSEIHFGKINLIEPTMIAPDEHNSSNFADIKDTRVNKSAVNISIKADPKFYDKFETYFVQSFQLILLENMPIDLSENYTVISSKDGDQINSIPWSRFEHLRLFITDGNIPTNTYHTTITWTYGNAPL